MTPHYCKSEERLFLFRVLHPQVHRVATTCSNHVACGKWKVGPLNFMLDYCKVLGTSQRPQPKHESKAQRGNGSAASLLIIQVAHVVFPFPLSMESSSQLRLVAFSCPVLRRPWLGLLRTSLGIPTASDLQGLARNSRWKPVASAKKTRFQF